MRRFAIAFILLVGAPAWFLAAPSSDITGPRPGPVEAPKPEALQGAIDRGIKFLVENQNKDGSWGSFHYEGGVLIYAPVPGAHDAFRAAVTALCLSALSETGGKNADAVRAVERAETWIMDNLAKVRRANGDAL